MDFTLFNDSWPLSEFWTACFIKLSTTSIIADWKTAVRLQVKLFESKLFNGIVWQQAFKTKNYFWKIKAIKTYDVAVLFYKCVL